MFSYTTEDHVRFRTQERLREAADERLARRAKATPGRVGLGRIRLTFVVIRRLVRSAAAS